MHFRPENPLIVQSDRTLLLEVNHTFFEEVRVAISPFTELVKSPEYIHTYRITPLSIWNACALGLDENAICDPLVMYAKYGVSDQLLQEIKEYVSRYGLLKIEQIEGILYLTSERPLVLTDILQYRDIRKWVGEERTEYRVQIDPIARGTLKQELIHLGYPVQDIAGYSDGTPLKMELRDTTLREYQASAVESYYCRGTVYGGNGVLVLPCGAGKTVIGIAAMVKVGMETLILTTNVTSVRQWVKEITQRTDLNAGQVGEFTSDNKEVKPVTISTYQMLTHKSHEGFLHINLFNERNWGLIIYDEVHSLPAPVFRLTADIQAKRRLGLTATLVREDGKEEEVFTLVGPKKYDVPWRELEKDGWIAQATCAEVRVPMPASLREEYAYSGARQKFRVAAENPEKNKVLRQILDQHCDDRVLIIGQYVEQLQEISKELKVPAITGKTPQAERDRLYSAFRSGEINRLIVSKVANFAVDLPDANVALQVSGTFGSRQEEAQRLGRILRPKLRNNFAFFYTLVSKESTEEEYALKRQMFLIEQGYQYRIIDSETIGTFKSALECR